MGSGSSSSKEKSLLQNEQPPNRQVNQTHVQKVAPVEEFEEQNFKANQVCGIEKEQYNSLKQNFISVDLAESVRRGLLERVIHFVENKEVEFSDIIDTQLMENIIHQICRYDQLELLQYVSRKVLDISPQSFCDIVYDQVNLQKETVVEICMKNNSEKCLTALFEMGGCQIRKKYAELRSLTASNSSDKALKLLLDFTNSGNVFYKRKINYNYMNRLGIDYFRNKIQKKYNEVSTRGFSYIDPEFLHIPQSVYGENVGEHWVESKDIVWLRPLDIIEDPKSQLSLFGKISPNDILQGESKTCYFLSVLQSLALNPEQIMQIFDSENSDPKTGRYCWKFNINGQKKIVTIDDYLPCSVITKQPIFSKISAKFSLWVPLIEKAWAKLHLSYSLAEYKLTEYAMEALLPYPAEGIFLKDYPSNEQLLKVLLNSIKDKSISVITTNSNIVETSTSLIPNHAYSILSVYETKMDVLIKLRNPWGKNSWKGQYSEASYQSELKRILGKLCQCLQQQSKFYKLKQKGDYLESEADGVFYASLGEVKSLFSYLSIQTIRLGYFLSSQSLKLQNRKSQYLKFTRKNPAEVCFRLIQQDDDLVITDFRLFKLSSNSKISTVSSNASHCWESLQSTYLSKRSPFISLLPGEYYLKVKFYKNEIELKNLLISIYSSDELKFQMLSKQEGKRIGEKIVDSFFENLQSEESPSKEKQSQIGILCGWDKNYRYFVRIENKSNTIPIEYDCAILMKQNMVLATSDMKVISKSQLKYSLKPKEVKIFKFVIKDANKKPKIQLKHSFV